VLTAETISIEAEASALHVIDQQIMRNRVYYVLARKPASTNALASKKHTLFPAWLCGY
jgi:hypothetical protein